MPGQFTVGIWLIIVIEAAIFLGLGHRVLDRMRLSDTQAAILLGIMLIGAFLPPAVLFEGVSLDMGGTLVPVGICLYLIRGANTRLEKVRALGASLVTGAAVFALESLLPVEPGTLPVDIDPIYLPAIIAGTVGYLAGRSRRTAFIAGVFGVLLADLLAMAQNLLNGIPGTFWNVGGAGAFDAVVISGFLAVLLAEVIGETREFLQGGPRREGRSEDMLRQLEHEDVPEAPTASEGRQDLRSDAGQRGTKEQKPSRGILRPFVWLAVLLSLGFGSSLSSLNDARDEVLDGRNYRMIDETGRLVTESARVMIVGDSFIDEMNRMFEVLEVHDRVATARNLGTVPLLDAGEADRSFGGPVYAFSLFDLFRGDSSRKPADDKKTLDTRDAGNSSNAGESRPSGKKSFTFSIYTTHNDESYVTNRGKASINGRGDIHDVAEVLHEKLKVKGFAVDQSDTIHLPHDRGAYRRSRRTAVDLLNQGSDFLIDVHRDAGPWTLYAAKVKGEWLTQIRLVVGRQNLNYRSNLAVAKKLKAIADDLHPGLLKGIFIGRGNYNQDLASRAILIEVGTEQNALESAEQGVSFFADVLARYAEDLLR